MNLTAYINAIVNAMPGPLRPAAKLIRDRLYALANDAATFARHIGLGFYRRAAKWVHFAVRITEFIGESIGTFYWLVTLWLPKVVTDFLNKAKTYATLILNQAKASLTNLINAVRTWAIAQINGVLAFARQVRDWAIKQVNYLLDSAKRLLTRVFDTWGTPERLATWLIGALWTVFLRFVYAQRERIASWFLRSSVSFTRWFASQLESVIARLL